MTDSTSTNKFEVTWAPGTDKRQTCCVCLQSVGKLPNGAVRPYFTQTYQWTNGDTRRFHYCSADAPSTIQFPEEG